MRLSARKLRAVSLASLTGMVLVACGSSSGQSQNLASDQTLKFPYNQEFGTLDPGELDAEVDSEIAQNLFDGPLRFDNSLGIQPDLAKEVPTTDNGGISADGKTYTFHLRQDVTFSNGDKMTAKDMVYSWNRSIALQGPYSSNLGAIVGFSTVKAAVKSLKPKKPSAPIKPNNYDTASAADKKVYDDAKALYDTALTKFTADQGNFQKQIQTLQAANDPKVAAAGITAPDGPDGFTVQVKLTDQAGWFLSAITLQSTTGMILDQNAVKTDARDWWRKPETLVGTGAFKMSAYTPKQSVDFKAVDNWWGTPKPVLKTVHLDIHESDAATESHDIAAWGQGNYDIVGYGGNSTQPKADILAIQQDPAKKDRLTLQPKVRTTWVSFNTSPSKSAHPAGGPFVTDPKASTADQQKAKDLRMAFALAIDKTELVKTVCANVLCSPATGGLVTKGLKGYLGDDTDPLAKFDSQKAKDLLKGADPTGTKTANLKYSYNTSGLNGDTATALIDQWDRNLGVKVTPDPQSDTNGFIQDRQAGKYVMARDGWQADYDHPQDWYDNLWGEQAESATANTSGYAGDASHPYNPILAKADTLPTDQAIPEYNKLGKMLEDDAVYIPLYYSVGQFLINPWVKGAGTNNFFDHYWNEISILQH